MVIVLVGQVMRAILMNGASFGQDGKAIQTSDGLLGSEHSITYSGYIRASEIVLHCSYPTPIQTASSSYLILCFCVESSDIECVGLHHFSTSTRRYDSYELITISPTWRIPEIWATIETQDRLLFFSSLFLCGRRSSTYLVLR